MPLSRLPARPAQNFLLTGASKNGDFIEAVRDFFLIELHNPLTRKTYWNEIRRLADWCARRMLALEKLAPRDLARYAEEDQRKPRTIHTGLSAIRTMLDFLVERGLLPVNPASRVRARRITIDEGATPALKLCEVRQLIGSIPETRLVDLRDRAIMGTLHYTLCRAGALLALSPGDYAAHGARKFLRLREKRGHEFRAPVPPELALLLDQYITAAGIESPSDPLFQSSRQGGKILTGQRLQAPNLNEMILRRARAAGIDGAISPHVLRATSITEFLNAGGSLEEAQRLARHKFIWTTKLYDRRKLDQAHSEIWRLSLER